MPANHAARLTQVTKVENRRSCLNCGRLGHLKKNCEKLSFYDKIGIEIEGWWFDLPKAQNLASEMCDETGNRDGSLIQFSSCSGDDIYKPLDGTDVDIVMSTDNPALEARRLHNRKCANGKNNDCRLCGAQCWEFKTKPADIAGALKQLTKLYPYVTSRSAGMHVHMSFKDPTSVSLLCSQKFFDYWNTQWEAWGNKNNIKGAFWERLREENQYCMKPKIAEFKGKTVVTKGGHKYRQVNFLPYDSIRTVEFRLLPMFQKASLSILAIEQLLDIVETYLQTADLTKEVNLKRPVAESADVPLKLPEVKSELELPPINLPSVRGEVDILAEPCKMGVVMDSKGKPTGVVRMFQYQVDTYMANAGADATKIKQKIADPKAHKVKWDEFNTKPTGRV